MSWICLIGGRRQDTRVDDQHNSVATETLGQQLISVDG